jgi:hypothetical protein
LGIWPGKSLWAVLKTVAEVGGALSLESPAVKYSRFIAPIVVIDPPVWIEI